MVKENCSADAATRQAAQEQPSDKLKVLLDPEMLAVPKHSLEGEKWIKGEGGTKAKMKWWVTQDHRVYIPEQLAYKLVHQQHELTHMGKTAFKTLLGWYYVIAHLPALCSSVSQQCVSCLQNNACQGPSRPTGTQHCGRSPFEDMDTDPTEVTQSRGYKYLLVFICTLSRWGEAFPTKLKRQGKPPRHSRETSFPDTECL